MNLTRRSIPLEEVIRDWPESHREPVQQLLEKYGAPDETTPDRLTWYNEGPFKRIVAYRDEMSHNFPMHHGDFIKHVIGYQVPLDKLPDLAQFNGSLSVFRTRGELVANCDSETTNVLILNLANALIHDRIDVANARQEFAEMMVAHSLGKELPQLGELRFELPSGETADPDVATMDMDTLAGVKEKLQAA